MEKTAEKSSPSTPYPTPPFFKGRDYLKMRNFPLWQRGIRGDFPFQKKGLFYFWTTLLSKNKVFFDKIQIIVHF